MRISMPCIWPIRTALGNTVRSPIDSRNLSTADSKGVVMDVDLHSRRIGENRVMAHRVLSHTADTGIEATAGSLAGLIHELAAGMFALVSTLRPGAARQWLSLTVESETVEDLVVDVLSDLLYRSEVEDVVFCAFQVDQGPGERAVTMRAGGVPVHEVEATGPPFKAVTYHGLVVEEREEGWYGRVYLDV